jgi:hypothetical protein
MLHLVPTPYHVYDTPTLALYDMTTHEKSARFSNQPAYRSTFDGRVQKKHIVGSKISRGTAFFCMKIKCFLHTENAKRGRTKGKVIYASLNAEADLSV